MKKLDIFSNSEPVILYHGSNQIIKQPNILDNGFTKDFGYGFYTTTMEKQAVSWARRKSRNGGRAIINVFNLDINYKRDLNNKIFNDMSDEWLDFICECRKDKEYKHKFDTVEGPMADDTISNAIGDYAANLISRKAFYALCEFKYPTHQLVLNTQNALNYLKFKEARYV